MEIDKFVKEEDIPFEYGVVRERDNAVSWSRYLATKRSAGDELNLDWLYERCLKEIKDDWHLWKEFLKWRIELLNDCDIFRHKDEYNKISLLFEQCLTSCGKVGDAWIMYMEWVIQFKDLKRIRELLGKALRSMSWEYHEAIWRVVIDFIINELLIDNKRYELSLEDSIYYFVHGEHSTNFDTDLWSSSILQRYSLICDDIEPLLIYIFKTHDWSTIVRVFEKHLSPNLKPSQTSLFELYVSYITSMILVDNSAGVAAVVDQCIELFPFKKGELKTYLIFNLIRQGKITEAELYLEKVISETKDIIEFSVLYDFWIRMEELLTQELIQKMKDDNSEKQRLFANIRLHADTLTSLIKNHTIRLNDLELRREPNNIKLWLERVKLFDTISDKAKVYADAVLTVDYRLQTTPGLLGELWCQYCRLFEEDIEKSEVLLDKATNVPFKFLVDLENVWLYWCEYRLKRSIDDAIKVLSVVLEIPDNHELLLQKFEKGESPAQAAIFSSKRLWAMYLDLLEVKGNYGTAVNAYETAILIKAATPAMFINYALLNESSGHQAEALAVFERSVEIFPPSVSKSIWDIYLDVALKADITKEQKRDIFESAIKLAASGVACVSFFEKYSDFELNLGFHERSVEILHKGAKNISDLESKCTLWEECINRSEKQLDVNHTRKLYEECIETLPNSKAIKFVLPFAILEESRNEVARCRALLDYGSKLLKPAQNEELWDFWRNFETMHGTKDSFKNMLKARRFLEDTMKVNTEEVSRHADSIEFRASTAKISGSGPPSAEDKGYSNTAEIDLGL